MKKLTIYLDDNIINKAKEIAKKNNISISKIVSEYIKLLDNTGKDAKYEISPLVKEISGILNEDKENYYKLKKEYYKHLKRKHL